MPTVQIPIPLDTPDETQLYELIRTRAIASRRRPVPSEEIP